MSPELRDDLGPDWDGLARLAREDERRHEEAINEHHRTTLTIRGFAVTAVAALIAAVFVSSSWIPAAFAVVLSLFFCFVDYYYSRLYTEVERRLRVLEQINRRYRGLLARKSRSAQSLKRLRVRLLTYSSGPAIPRTPSLRPIRPLGRSFLIFVPLYLGLLLAAVAGGVYAVSSDGNDSPVVIQCVEATPTRAGYDCRLGKRQLGGDGRGWTGVRPRGAAR